MGRERSGILRRVPHGPDRLWASGTLRLTRSVSTTASSTRSPTYWLISVPRSTSVFQQIDIDESTDATTGSTLRLFGLTKKGNSVLLHVHGFKPYFYVAAPKDFMTEDCKHLRDQLNVSRTKFRSETTTRKHRLINLNNPFLTGLGDSRQPGSRGQCQHLYAEVVMGLPRQPERAFHQDHMCRPEVHPEGER